MTRSTTPFGPIIGLWLAGLLLTVPLGCSSVVHADPTLGSDHPPPPELHLVSNRGNPASQTAITDLRYHRYEHYTRLVLDLGGPVEFTESPQEDQGRVLIRLPNATMDAQARLAKTQDGFPRGVRVIPTKGGAVHLWLDTEFVADYKLFSLEDPKRLVVDLYSNHQHPREAPAPSRRVIVLDPGHGGKDPGAMGRKGTKEKDIVLEVAFALKRLLRKHTNAEVLMTRERDVFIELEDRAAFANKHKADLFVSIHVNSHPHRSIKGVEIYHFGQAEDQRALEVAARENGKPVEESGLVGEILGDFINGQKTIRSQELAFTTSQTLVSHIQEHFKVTDHGVKTAPFYVLRYTTMPSILAELGFISNPAEERRIQTPSFQNRMAEAIFHGLQAYLNGQPLQTASR